MARNLRFRNAVLLIVGALFGTFAFAAPAISTISPTVGPVSPVGSPVTINGSGFGTTQSDSIVTIGGFTTTPTSWSDSRIIVPVPRTLMPGFMDVIVTVGGTASNAASFLVIPVITNDSPASGPVGTSVVVTGTSFGDTQGDSTVTFNGVPVSPTSWSNTSLTVSAPGSAITGVIVVTVNGFATNGAPFRVLPNITAIGPTAGLIGSSVTVSGTTFGQTQGFGGVTFSGVSATVQNWSDSSISVLVPAGATSGNVVVTDHQLLASNGLNFNVIGLVSLALSPANPSVAINSIQQLQLTATGLYSDGSSTDLTSSVTWTTSDRSVAMVLPTPGTRGIVGTANAGTATITASFAGISGSTSVTVTPAAAPTVPNIADVSPPTATAGTQVTVTGTGFGSSQGNGSVWLGSTLGTIVTWSDTQVVATVATGSTTGTAQIQQAGVSSNALPFTVITPIISSITPASGLAGTPVAINGTGFGNTQSTGQVWLGTAPGVVTSWNDTQILATVAVGSTTGTAQVLQAGVVSNAVPFAVNTPSINSITPTSGIADTSVTINGSGFGSAQGSGIAWIGSAQGVVVSWTDTQVVATVDSTAVSGIVRIQQNGIWSNALSFRVPPSLSTAPSVNINPNLGSMVVGETRSLQALDDSGQALAGLTWASTDLTVATLSTDDPPIITALAPGHVTITAGNASADLTVYPWPALPLGAVQWSLAGDGSGVAQILPAVPSDSGVDVFALQQSGNIQAVKTDGRVAWTSTVGTDKKLVPDFQGGLIIAAPNTISKLDGITGLPYPSYTLAKPIDFFTPPVLVHTDGTVLTVDGNTVVGIDPLTGHPKFNVQLENTIFSSNGNCGEFTPSETSEPPDFGPPIIAGDGFAYFPYHYTESPLASNGKVCFPNTQPGDMTEASFIHTQSHFRVLRVATDGSYSKIVLGDWTFDQVTQSFVGAADVVSSSGATPFFFGQLGTLITNADQGVFFSWDLDFENGSSPAHQLTTIIGSSASTISLPVPGSFQPMLQGSDGTLFGTVTLPTDPSGQPGSTFMIALDTLHQPKWTLPNVSPQYATPQGGTIITSTFTTPDGSQQLGSLRAVDQFGNQTSQIANPGAFLAWSGNWYGTGALNAASTGSSPGPALNSYALDPVTFDSSFWPDLHADPSQSSVGNHFTKEVTVIGWINAQSVALPDPGLVDPNIPIELRSTIACPVLLKSLSDGDRSSISNDADRQFVNAFLIQQSANGEPPPVLDPSVLKEGDFRAYNRSQAIIDPIGNQVFQAKFFNTRAVPGDTPDSCHSVFTSLANYIAFGGKLLKPEAHPDSGKNGVAPGRLHAFNIVEARVGPEAQAANRTLNACLTRDGTTGFCNNPVPPVTPYIWAITEFDYLGQYTVGTQIFPTYYVYEDGKLVPSKTITQSDVEQFIKLDAQSQIKASDIK